MVAVPSSAGAQGRGVGARARLGEAVGGELLHPAQHGQPASALRLGAKLSIIQAHMLWIEMKAATVGHPVDRASKITAASSRLNPAPPISSRT